MKVREVIKILERHGFQTARWRGSHRVFVKSDGKRERVIASGNDGDEVPKDTLATIRRQSGLARSLFR